MLLDQKSVSLLKLLLSPILAVGVTINGGNPTNIQLSDRLEKIQLSFNVIALVFVLHHPEFSSPHSLQHRILFSDTVLFSVEISTITSKVFF